jgi:FlaA1/EpsC-like NDP-sugar epimerase
LHLSGVYTFIWRYVGLAEMKTFFKAMLVWLLPVLALRFLLSSNLQEWRIPLSIIVIDSTLAFSGIIGIRVIRRILFEHYEKKMWGNGHKGDSKSVLLVGAGRAGVMTVKEILGRGDLSLKIVGFVDDDLLKQRSVIQSIKVLGTTQDLPRLVKENEVNHIVISIAKASRQDFRRILDICESIPIKVRVIPGLYEILQGKVNISRLRDVEIQDLLGREQVHLDEEAIGLFLAGKNVMVTGAGGSIGSELVRQVARVNPAKLILVERAEPSLFNINREISESWPALNPIPIVADIADEQRMRYVFEAHCPQVILHAAAHKHVPLMESNSNEAIKNNVLATHLLGELAGEYGAEVFVLISTDKAVRPTSVMGASKRFAELVIQSLDKRYSTRYLAVRFGNVIGSTGSVIPIFREQIRKGGPITVTHPEMIRYFMTIPEAAQLVLQAGTMGKGGEIFILDMGEPVSILQLAIDTILLSGFKPYEDIDIVFTGLRPGEKLFEELQTDGENITKTQHPKIFIGTMEGYPAGKIDGVLGQLEVIMRSGQEQELRIFLNKLLPEAHLSLEPAQSLYSIAVQDEGLQNLSIAINS